jgi:alpha-amylase/alpha-mannosidase (GH57 family)
LLKLAFLWHQHQPFYKDLTSGYYHMPWVRLHGTKDYLDMALILKDYPRIKQTFNLVPSLLEQIADYAEGKAKDPHLELSAKKASELSEQDKLRMLDLHFQANYDNMIRPFPQYRELHRRRLRAMAEWGEKEWRDLQCLSNLAWIDPMFRKSGRMAELVAKGESYTEDDKTSILKEQENIISRIIPELREMMDSGQIEISTSPYYHPILPLLCDSSAAREALPLIELPEGHFRHPEDAETQVAMAVELYTGLFGKPPAGMWPSEGAVSEEIIPIIHRHGIRWIATDEGILAASMTASGKNRKDVNDLIGTGDLYRSYLIERGEAHLSIFFRDHGLSDSIGFVYSQWDPEKAAADFLAKLKAVERNVSARGIADPVVSVILDGENAWEYYPEDGHQFLSALYEGIAAADWLETTTFSEFLEGNPEPGRLERLFPGSWINRNFAIWIGHPEDNKAWDLLQEARDDLCRFEESHPEFDRKKLKDAWKEIYIAEGSDWCWWFGDDHIGPNNDEFDRLFRSHLANVYKLTEREPLPELMEPVRTRFRPSYLSMPVNYITPTIDGKLTHYYEWQQAGFFDCLRAGTTMHRADTAVSGIWFGFDQRNIYLRIDRAPSIEPERFRSFSFVIEFSQPADGSYIRSSIQETLNINGIKRTDFSSDVIDILEISIGRAQFDDKEKRKYSFRVHIREKDKLLESWPQTEGISFEIPGPGSDKILWTV